jgi:hypothetical protein
VTQKRPGFYGHLHEAVTQLNDKNLGSAWFHIQMYRDTTGLSPVTQPIFDEIKAGYDAAPKPEYAKL